MDGLAFCNKFLYIVLGLTNVEYVLYTKRGTYFGARFCVAKSKLALSSVVFVFSFLNKYLSNFAVTIASTIFKLLPNWS